MPFVGVVGEGLLGPLVGVGAVVLIGTSGVRPQFRSTQYELPTTSLQLEPTDGFYVCQYMRPVKYHFEHT